MKRLVLTAICALAFGTAHAEDKGVSIDQIAWLAGCWQSPDGTGNYDERWMPPKGQTMLGMSRTVQDGKTVAWEFLRIHQEADGIYYTSNPSGQAQASFKLIECKEGHVVFENPTHDFPQRIIYQVDKDGMLMASIEGLNKGSQKRVDFPMRRTDCK